MYRDTEEAYRGWTLDVYQSTLNGNWCVDYSYSGTGQRGSKEHRLKKAAVLLAQAEIDLIEKGKANVHP